MNARLRARMRTQVRMSGLCTNPDSLASESVAFIVEE